MLNMDTLQAYQTLRAKFDEETAKTVVTAVTQLLTPSFADLATKTDLTLTADQLRSEMNQLRSEMNQLRSEMNQLRSELKAELATTKADLLKWSVSMMLAQIAATVGLLKLLL